MALPPHHSPGALTAPLPGSGRDKEAQNSGAPEVNNFFLEKSPFALCGKTFSFFLTYVPAVSPILRDSSIRVGSMTVLTRGLKCFDILSSEGEASLPGAVAAL